MAEPTPTFAGEVQFRRYSDTSTQGTQIVLALADREALECFIGKEGKRFAAVLIEIGDDELPVDPRNSGDVPIMSQPHFEKPREHLGDLCWRAVQWCKEPEFWLWISGRMQCHSDAIGEVKARDYILFKCGIESRKELDTNKDAASKFHAMIRGPYQKHLIARGVVR